MRWAALGLALLASGCARAARDQPPAPHLGELALPFVGPTPPVNLRGKVVLVSFFATWCFPCIAELPLLERLQTLYGEKGFTVVAVGMDLEEAKVLQPFADNYRLPFPVLVGDDRLRSGQTTFGRIAALPSYVLFDRQGKAVLGYQGVASPEKLIEVVGAAVRE